MQNQKLKIKNKKYGHIIIMSLLLVVSCLLLVNHGCGQQETPTTTTTSTTTSSTGTTTSTTTSTTTTTDPNLVATPTFTLSPGTYEANSLTVTIECSTLGSQIYYSLDGSTPTPSSRQYTNSLSLEVSKTIKAIAAKSGLTTSEVGTAVYNLYWWQALEDGLNDCVLVLALDSSGNLYAGGSFTEEAGNNLNYIAKWDGSTWEALGTGMNDSVAAITFNSSGHLFAGGAFTSPANHVAKWVSPSWSNLGSGVDDVVRGLIYDTGAGVLYVGGELTAEAGDSLYYYIAKYDELTWTTLSGQFDGRIYDFYVTQTNDLYTAGEFGSIAGFSKTARIAKWDSDSSSWSALGSGISGLMPVVHDIILDSSNNLYAGGQNFNSAGGVTANNIAKWDGDSWFALGNGLSPSVFTVAVDSSDNLYAGGWFTSAEGVVLNNIGKWNNSSWEAVGNGMDSGVYSLAFDSTNNILYAGGTFTTAGSVAARSVAKWGKKQ